MCIRDRVSPLRLRWVEVCASLGVTCHQHIWQNDRGLLRAIAVTRGVERTPNESQRTKLTQRTSFVLEIYETATSVSIYPVGEWGGGWGWGEDK